MWSTAIITGVLFFACLFAHELSHAVVAKARGIPVHKITLFLLGGVAQIEKEASDAENGILDGDCRPHHERGPWSGPARFSQAFRLDSVDFGNNTWDRAPGMAGLHQSCPGCIQHDSGLSARWWARPARDSVVGDG